MSLPVPKYRKGDRFQANGKPTFYQDWKTVVIVGDPYTLHTDGRSGPRVYYPVHVNGERYEVLPEANIPFNFDVYVEFKPGFYEFVSDDPNTRGPIKFFREKPENTSSGYWQRRRVVDWNGALHD